MDQMDAFSTFLLVIHVLAAILGLGVVAAFPFLGMAARHNRVQGAIMSRMITLIKRRTIYPAGAVQLITGIILIWTLGISLTHNAWLGASIVLFLIIFGIATGASAPVERKLIANLESASGTDLSAEAIALMDRLKIYNVIFLAGVAVIAILMVWQPGGNM